ncbi:MAG: YIP1 family protein [Chloroflexi bacterium]|nr:YIP1 family protein [Chloroflexota bacterium]
MTELNPPQSTSKFNFGRILAVLFQPRRTFAEIAGETGSSWLTPMLALSLSGLLGVIVSGYLKARAAMMGEITLPPDWQYWTPEMQNNFMQGQQSMQGPVFVYVIPFVFAMIGLWLGWLIFSGLLHLGSTLLGGRGSMSGALNVVGWAYLPFVARDLLRVVYMLLAQHPIVSAGLSGFASNAVFWAQILSRVDIFFIWSAILLMIGFSASDGLSKGKSITGVVIVLLILLLAQAGLGALTSSIGGLATSNPIF